MEPKRVARAVADARILLIGKTVIPTGAPITPERSTAALTVDLDLAGIRMETAIGVPYPIIKWVVWMQPKRVARAVAEVNRQTQRQHRQQVPRLPLQLPRPRHCLQPVRLEHRSPE